MDAATTGRSEPNQPVVLRFKLNDSDFAALSARIRYLLNLPGWIVSLTARFIVALLPAFLFWLAGDPVSMIAGVIYGLIAFVAFPYLTRYLARRRIRAVYKPSQLDIHLMVEDRDIRLQGGEDSSSISWNSIERGEETRTHFLLFLTRLQAVVIPKRAFADESSMTRFRQMISERIKNFVSVG